jgi:simple sugar transport system ATP-binding protein
MTLVADKISVMRDGTLIDTTDIQDVTPNSLARQMLGNTFEDSAYKNKSSLIYEATLDPADKSIFFFFESGKLAHTADTRDTKVTTPKNSSHPKHKNPSEESGVDKTTFKVSFESLNVQSNDSRVGISNFNLCIKPGEIHGLAGVEGNGQDILVEVLSSLKKPNSGKLKIGEKEIDFSKSNSMNNSGIAVVPADRHFSGCILDMSLAENLAFGRLEEFINKGRINYSKLNRHASKLVEEFRISAPSLQTPFRFLSGGNQQKAVLAREMAKKPKLLVVSQPTFGLDVNAMSFIWDQLREISNKNTPVLVVSNDLEEILDLSETISVINRGTIVGEMKRQDFDVEKFGLLIGEKL